jgi:hypothetical protein
MCVHVGNKSTGFSITMRELNLPEFISKILIMKLADRRICTKEFPLLYLTDAGSLFARTNE